MELKTKLYPYPVLYKKSDDYIDSSFTGDADVSLEGANLCMHFSVDLKNEKLAELVEEKKAAFLYHLECPATGLRTAHCYEPGESDLLIPQQKVRGDFQVCSFIAALTDIKQYTNAQFNPDYRGAYFDIDAGCVLAVGEQIHFNIDPQLDDFSNTPSIFSIIKNADPAISVMCVELDGHKIRVYLPQTDYANYKTLKTNACYRPVLNSLIVLPALIFTLEEICSTAADERADQYGEYRWYKSLRKALLKMNLDCESVDFINAAKEKNMVVHAQKLIGQPTSAALNFLRDDVGEEDEA